MIRECLGMTLLFRLEEVVFMISPGILLIIGILLIFKPKLTMIDNFWIWLESNINLLSRNLLQQKTISKKSWPLEEKLAKLSRWYKDQALFKKEERVLKPKKKVKEEIQLRSNNFINNTSNMRSRNKILLKNF